MILAPRESMRRGSSPDAEMLETTTTRRTGNGARETRDSPSHTYLVLFAWSDSRFRLNLDPS